MADLSREIVDDVIERGECDLVHDVTGRLPSGLIAELMGMPRADGERLYELTEIMHTTDDAVAPPEVKMAASAEMLGYGQQLAERKRAEPGDDIATTLVNAVVDGDRLTDAEFQWFFLLLVNAGGDTTRNLLAAGIQMLFDHPAQRARLMGDLDGLMPTAIEEMLRYTSPVVNFRRTAMEDTVIRDQPIAAGDKLMVFYGSANRDEDVFADADAFDVGRNPNPHQAFGGGGPHLCLGHPRGPAGDRRDVARAAHPRARPAAGRRARGAGLELHRRRADDAGVVHPGTASGRLSALAASASASGGVPRRRCLHQRHLPSRTTQPRPHRRPPNASR